jgi:hypothetical protein
VREGVLVSAVLAILGATAAGVFTVLIGRLKTEQSAQHWSAGVVSGLVSALRDNNLSPLSNV